MFSRRHGTAVHFVSMTVEILVHHLDQRDQQFLFSISHGRSFLTTPLWLAASSLVSILFPRRRGWVREVYFIRIAARGSGRLAGTLFKLGTPLCLPQEQVGAGPFPIEWSLCEQRWSFLNWRLPPARVSLPIMATEQFGDWEIVERSPADAAGWMAILMWPLLLLPGAPTRHSSITWTVRHRQTGDVQKVTAYTEDLAALKIAAREFDKD